jgi:peptidoglycan hydrolase CwlO-like protein
LQDSIEQLDLDIENTLIKVDKINKSVIQVKKEIEVNEQTISILKRKISENMDILLEYLIYVYKK